MAKKIILKGSVFIIILMMIISMLNSIFVLKVSHRSKIFQGAYEDRGEYDVVLMGSSHMDSSINPNVLWNQYGITSFNYGTGGQPIDVTYYLLKDVLKKHKNPIVVLDLYYLGLTEQFGQEAYIRYVLDNMKFSVNKIEAIVNSTPKNQWLSYLFPLIKYHNRWKELEEKDFNYDTSTTYYQKGFGAGREVYGKDTLSDIKETKTAELPAKTQEYLYKIIELSKKEGFKLVFTNAPHDYKSTANMDTWHKEPAQMFNKVAEIAKENNIPFINYNNLFDEIGFDFKNDMYNEGHMNIWGSNKVSTHFAKFLKENYDLEDHRNDEKYANWEKEYAKYLKVEAAAK